MAEALRHTGDRSRAAIEIKRAAELADLIQDPLRCSQIRLVEGHLHRDCGQNHEAAQSYEVALAAAETAGRRSTRPEPIRRSVARSQSWTTPPLPAFTLIARSSSTTNPVAAAADVPRVWVR